MEVSQLQGTRGDLALAKREREWNALSDEWAFFGICNVCDELAHVRGKRKTNVKCHPCFIKPRRTRDRQ